MDEVVSSPNSSRFLRIHAGVRIGAPKHGGFSLKEHIIYPLHRATRCGEGRGFWLGVLPPKREDVWHFSGEGKELEGALLFG